MNEKAPPPEQAYRERTGRFTAACARLQARAGSISNLRLLAFAAAVGGLIWTESGGPDARVPALVLATLGLAGFVALLFLHSHTRRRLSWCRAHSQLAAEGLHRLARDWDRLPPTHAALPREHAYAADLDVLGHASLLRLVGPPATAGGRARLVDWLLAPAGPEVVRRRQAAVRELAPRVELRHEWVVRGRLGRGLELKPLERFVDWAERGPWLRARPGLLWTSRLLPLATIALLWADLSGAVDAALWLMPMAAGLWLTARQHDHLRGTLGDVAPADRLREHVRLLVMIEAQSFEAALLQELQARLGGSRSRSGATRALGRLRSLLSAADLRLSFIHFIVHLLTLWDFHVVSALERWQQRHGAHVRGWLNALSEMDALIALATLTFDEPDWAFAELVTQSAPRLDAAALAHPLLSRGVRIANDVDIGTPGSFLLVTGSNMSGKSTLLRAVGTNVVLAQAGAPVCASSFTMTPLRPHTSMRVRDSLEQGLSFFMAEVRRLARVVDAARERDQPAVLYLLDEILQGTNAEEHRTGARWVLEHLIAGNAIGAVATHDLTLADAQPLRDATRHVHFRETVEQAADGPRMRFDYRLRPGPAETRNALLILRLSGLGPAPTDGGSR